MRLRNEIEELDLICGSGAGHQFRIGSRRVAAGNRPPESLMHDRSGGEVPVLGDRNCVVNFRLPRAEADIPRTNRQQPECVSLDHIGER